MIYLNSNRVEMNIYLEELFTLDLLVCFPLFLLSKDLKVKILNIFIYH